MAILSSHATRRDAKAYFGRFGSESKFTKRQKGSEVSSGSSEPGMVHMALVKLCRADSISSVDILPGLAKTLVQLGRLGMPSCVVVEAEENYLPGEPASSGTSSDLRERQFDIVNRVVDAIENQGGKSVPVLDGLLDQPASAHHIGTQGRDIVGRIRDTIESTPASVSPTGREFLFNCIRRDQIPVVAPVACGLNPSLLRVSADGAIYRICEGLTAKNDPNTSSQVAIERVIIVDPVGGLPTSKRQEGFHVYVNLRQEYDGMLVELTSEAKTEVPIPSNSLHLRNLILIDRCLELMSPTSSALITTASIASATPPRGVPQSLIHNLLTDKPLVSPSLPSRRSVLPAPRTTLLRKGLPVTVYEDIKPSISGHGLDFTRLSNLIEDSFGRHLDVDRYRKRIRGKVAAIIVAGDYEGAAVVTKESPSSSPSGAWIPYLDKFAVSTKSQGSGGVADILFNALTSAFPDDLIWRSRKSNPVNKWVIAPDVLITGSISSGRVVLGGFLGRNGVFFGRHLESRLTNSLNMWR
jgi:amino-acid N-acetyltransferase